MNGQQCDDHKAPGAPQLKAAKYILTLEFIL